jgi:hypothetical protein
MIQARESRNVGRVLPDVSGHELPALHPERLDEANGRALALLGQDPGAGQAPELLLEGAHLGLGGRDVYYRLVLLDGLGRHRVSFSVKVEFLSWFARRCASICWTIASFAFRRATTAG